MKQFSRQLTAANFTIPQQLTADEQYGISLVYLSLIICVTTIFNEMGVLIKKEIKGVKVKLKR